jgi:hypothetical protein
VRLLGLGSYQTVECWRLPPQAQIEPNGKGMGEQFARNAERARARKLTEEDYDWIAEELELMGKNEKGPGVKAPRPLYSDRHRDRGYGDPLLSKQG